MISIDLCLKFLLPNKCFWDIWIKQLFCLEHVRHMCYLLLWNLLLPLLLLLLYIPYENVTQVVKKKMFVKVKWHYKHLNVLYVPNISRIFSYRCIFLCNSFYWPLLLCHALTGVSNTAFRQLMEFTYTAMLVVAGEEEAYDVWKAAEYLQMQEAIKALSNKWDLHIFDHCSRSYNCVTRIENGTQN